MGGECSSCLGAQLVMAKETGPERGEPGPKDQAQEAQQVGVPARGVLGC